MQEIAAHGKSSSEDVQQPEEKRYILSSLLSLTPVTIAIYFYVSLLCSWVGTAAAVFFILFGSILLKY